ncbi:hypothetical protein ACVWY0_003058 [Arthrobacter sp. UYNi723]
MAPLPSDMFKGDDYLVRKVRDLERLLQQVMAANPLATAGISAKPGGFAVTGTMDLPPGIIGNAALAAPVSPGSAGLTQQNFATTTAGATYAQASITVPAGYTQALVMNGVSAGATNSGTASDFIYIAASINGTSGGEQPAQTLAGAYGSGSAFAIRTLTGLTGGSITVECKIRTGSGVWAAATGNTASVNALVLFLK